MDKMDKRCTRPKETVIPNKPCRTDYVDKLQYRRDYASWMMKYNPKFREKKLIYMRKHMHEKYHTDSAFREKHLQYVNKRQHFLYHNDPEFKRTHNKLNTNREILRCMMDSEYKENRLRKQRERYHANKVLKKRK